MDINQLLQELKQVRLTAEVARLDKESAQAQWAEVEKNHPLYQEYAAAADIENEAKTKAAALEAQIRELAIEAYIATGNKKPAEGVQVKIFSLVRYEPASAYQWCLQNFTPALKLDTKVFEKAAKDGTLPADLASIEEEARAQIASEL